MKRWKCDLCGYFHQGKEIPASCVLCGADSDHFSPLNLTTGQQKPAAEQWRCSICDHIHSGNQLPEQCGVCGAAANLFVAVVTEVSLCRNGEIDKILILGGGIAGLTAAEEARKCSTRAQITLISKEAVPYYRLNLTRFLAGQLRPGSDCRNQCCWRHGRISRSVAGHPH